MGFSLSLQRAAVAIVATVLSTAVLASDYKAPRLANGQPDFQGVWTNASLTQLIRSSRYKNLTLDDAQAEAIETARAKSMAAQNRPTDPNAPAPTAGGGGVGGYNAFWMAPGDRMAKIDGKYRTSWIVEPKNGQIPYTKKGAEMFATQAALYRNHVDNPEGRPMAERCIIGYGSTGGPPMINVLYNNNYQFFQTDDHVVILVEMNHDARIVRLNDKHLPSNMRPWLGDSIGHWDGDTLVVETSNINPGERLRLNFNNSFYVSENAKIVERFTRTGKDEMLYQFEVTDPEIFKQTWKAEVLLSAVEGQIYEYACHEGNYALPNILAGAREEEKK